MTEDKEDKEGKPGEISKLYWRFLAALLIISVFIYLWTALFSVNAPAYRTINYSEFIEQLNAGNITSVSLKKERVSGEFMIEASILLAGEKSPAPVKYFTTLLPIFQGEGLLSLLKRYSEEMAWLMDQEIQKIIVDAETKATTILSGKRHTLDALAEALIKEEMLERADVERIMQGANELKSGLDPTSL